MGHFWVEDGRGIRMRNAGGLSEFRQVSRNRPWPYSYKAVNSANNINELGSRFHPGPPDEREPRQASLLILPVRPRAETAEPTQNSRGKCAFLYCLKLLSV